MVLFYILCEWVNGVRYEEEVEKVKDMMLEGE